MLWVIPSELSQRFQVQTNKNNFHMNMQMLLNDGQMSRALQIVLVSTIIMCNQAKAILMEILLPSPFLLEIIQWKASKAAVSVVTRSSRNKARSMKNWCFYYSKVSDKVHKVLYVGNIFRSCVPQNGGIKSTTILSFVFLSFHLALATVFESVWPSWRYK